VTESEVTDHLSPLNARHAAIARRTITNSSSGTPDATHIARPWAEAIEAAGDDDQASARRPRRRPAGITTAATRTAAAPARGDAGGRQGDDAAGAVVRRRLVDADPLQVRKIIEEQMTEIERIRASIIWKA
jgi:hypothetical protein